MPVGALADRAVVARQLKLLAAEPGLAARHDELIALADALRGRGDVEPWTELDLLDAYARPESVHALRIAPPDRAFWGWLEAGIGALVFLPLLLTWYALSEATSAYEALIGEEPKAAARPFLQLWQTGFEGRLTGWSTFGDVAVYASWAIVLLFVLTAVHGVRRAREDRREAGADRTAAALLARLVPLLTQAQLHLNKQRLTSPARFTGELSRAAVSLGQLVVQASQTQERLTAAAASVGSSVESAERRLAGVDAAVQPLEGAARRIETAVTRGGGEVGKALDGVTAMNGEVRDVLDRAGERVEDSVHTLGAAQRSFTTATEVATDVSARVLDRLTAVTEQTAKAVAGSQEAAVRLSEEARALRETADRFAELVDALARSGAALGARAGGADRPAAMAAYGNGHDRGHEPEDRVPDRWTLNPEGRVPSRRRAADRPEGTGGSGGTERPTGTGGTGDTGSPGGPDRAADVQ
ncbi:methyl-accepting chemotaxis protein [Streptomyces uncialis]|uniref:methyl-accepting chemotaxis protein n=1 Tax=Streptomyces uncialis TaxID=1048205 RepID=UPI0033FF2C85